MDWVDEFIRSLNSCTEVLSTGRAVVLGQTVAAVEVRNLYGQRIVWGKFGCNRGKFKGTLSNDASTEEVSYTTT
jgi:hypothetical protein